MHYLRDCINNIKFVERSTLKIDGGFLKSDDGHRRGGAPETIVNLCREIRFVDGGNCVLSSCLEDFLKIDGSLDRQFNLPEENECVPGRWSITTNNENTSRGCFYLYRSL
jgi:hypothetical protein